MQASKITELLKTLHVFHSVYELQPIEQYGEQSHHRLLLMKDFDTEEEAIAFVIENVTSYHSLTIIKRYE